MTHCVLGHHAWLDELQQAVGAARLRADPGPAVTSEWLTTHHRSSDIAIDVEIAHRCPPDDVVDGRWAAREQAARERERGCVDGVACGRHVGDALDREQRTEDLLAQHARTWGQAGGETRRAEPALGRRLRAERGERALAGRSARVALDALLRLAFDQRRYVGGEL